MATETDLLTVGPWRASRMTGRLQQGGIVRDLEPKVMDLLYLLASRRGEVFSRDDILAALWPGVTVGEDALSRCVFKLRKALDDDPRTPAFVETIPKRGYRLLADPAAPEAGRKRLGHLPPLAGVALLIIALAAVLLWRPAGAGTEADRLVRRGDDLYFQFNRRGNEAAMTLYERALATDPNSVTARAGLANALAQQAIRYGDPPPERTTLGQALKIGATRTPQARARLDRARDLAQAAVAADPGDAVALKALGFVLSARGDLAGAEAVYRRALKADPDAWGALINLGEVADLRGDGAAALAHLERAYEVMGRLYGREAQKIGPWQSELGVDIARRHAADGRVARAEGWYRKVLAETPLHPAATVGLAGLRAGQGDPAGAARLCRELVERTGPNAGCEPYL
jgi:transcriptional activator of cad operon